jgi:peptide/nickel transport system substrate-binding protein
MFKKLYTLQIAICLYMIAGILSCTNTADESSTEVTIRLANEPESLHPIFSKSIYATQIESLILLPITEYDPVSMELSPVLLSAIPKGQPMMEGPHIGGTKYALAFRPESVWADGKPVTGEDYLFTVKSVFNPYVNASAWKNFMSFISEIVLDPENPKNVSVYLDSAYSIAIEAITNWNLYPAHVYDPENLMSSFTLEELSNPDQVWTAEQDSLLKRFATLYESPEYFRETVSGSGAYELDQWVTGEYIRLKRKENWWGDQVKNPPLLLQAYPTYITYRIILDEAAAEAAIKNGEIDLMADINASAFNRLRNHPEWKDKLNFDTPALMQVNYIEINHRNPILADVRVRKALAYTIDYDGLLNNVMEGLATRSTGPIHPDKSYYNSDLKPLSRNIKKSLELLEEAGWRDTNENGTPDKVINGKLEELHLEIKLTNKSEGLATSTILKENAEEAGFDIELVIVDPGQIQQDVRQRNFDLLPIRIRAFPHVDDPYSIWHSDNDKPGGGNRSGFISAALDSSIIAVRSTDDPTMQEAALKRFQQILYDEQAGLFLYTPLERIVSSKRIQYQPSSRRPGYFENLIKPAK